MKKIVVKKKMILVENMEDLAKNLNKIMEDLAKNLNKIMEDLANNLNKVMENMAKDHHFKVMIITTMIMVSKFLLSTTQENIVTMKEVIALFKETEIGYFLIPFLGVKTNLQYLISVV